MLEDNVVQEQRLDLAGSQCSGRILVVHRYCLGWLFKLPVRLWLKNGRLRECLVDKAWDNALFADQAMLRHQVLKSCKCFDSCDFHADFRLATAICLLKDDVTLLADIPRRPARNVVNDLLSLCIKRVDDCVACATLKRFAVACLEY